MGDACCYEFSGFVACDAVFFAGFVDCACDAFDIGFCFDAGGDVCLCDCGEFVVWCAGEDCDFAADGWDCDDAALDHAAEGGVVTGGWLFELECAF